jgi:hypothetical protein
LAAADLKLILPLQYPARWAIEPSAGTIDKGGEGHV